MPGLLTRAGLGTALAILFSAAPAGAASGGFALTFGKDVGPGGASLCTVAADCLGGTAFTDPGGFDTPTGVAADQAGHVYVVDTDNSRIERFDASGNFVGLLNPASGTFNSARDVAIASSGDVYVVEPFQVEQYDSAGAFVRTWGKDVGGPGQNTCTASCQTPNPGTGDGEFNSAAGIGVDDNDNVYVADSANNRIQKFGPNGAFVTKWGASGALGGEFASPNDVAGDPNGFVVVTDTNNRRVQQFNLGGGFVRAFGKGVNAGAGPADMCTVAASCQAGSTGGLGGQFDVPRYVTADGGGVYVSDGNQARIEKFDSSGNFLRAWGRDVDTSRPGAFGICTVAGACAAGTVGGKGGEMSDPYGVALGAGGELYVSDFGGNARVQKFVTGTPVITGVSPASPANANFPAVKGTADAGTTVTLYGTPTCDGTPIGIGGNAVFSSTGIAGHAPDDSTTTFYARAVDESGQSSGCSPTSATYVEDSTAPDTLLDSPPTGTIATATPTIAFHATEPSATFECRFDAQAFAPCSGAASDTPLFPLTDGAHTFDVAATDQAGNLDAAPGHASFTVDASGAPPVLPPPVVGRTVNAVPDNGKVFVKLPRGTRKAPAGFVPLAEVGEHIPVGSTLDTSKGQVHLFAARDTKGTLEDGHFKGGLFVIGQGRKNPLATLSMTGGGLRSCGKVPRGGSPKLSAARKKRRQLFSNVHGRFRSRGRNSTATVRGTQWTMTDTCTGTRTSVRRGSVVVRDLVKHRKITLKAGQSYLAHARLRKHKRKG